MAVLEDAAEQFFGQAKLTGFTLFEHVGKGWQMSVRPRGEVGWIVKIIPDDEAKAILAILETDPRFGPVSRTLDMVKPKPNRLIGVSLDGPFLGANGDAEILIVHMKEAEFARVSLTAAIRDRTAALAAKEPL